MSISLDKIIQLFSDKGCSKIYAKILSPNDNSKNQVYLGGSFNVLSIFPYKEVWTDDVGIRKKVTFKASLDFFWLTEKGDLIHAPHAQLILYPKYPEVRLSGFLRGCKPSPTKLMSSRDENRILFLSTNSESQLISHVVSPDSAAAIEFNNRDWNDKEGVFNIIPIIEYANGGNTKDALILKLKKIHDLGWITAKKMNSDGSTEYHKAPQSGGYTLEAELGIPPNGISLPDYLGWEIKQFNVTSFKTFNSASITLMTPEPNGGHYKEWEPAKFIQTYGYKDKKGRPDRMNFGGVHKYDIEQRLTGLTMLLSGYDIEKKEIIDASGAIVLLNGNNQIAALWTFAKLIEHWGRKHAYTCYVPSMKRNSPLLEYSYSNLILLCSGTNFNLFLSQMVSGCVVYDPSLKMENISIKPKIKKRNQFRTTSKHLGPLYENNEFIDLNSI